MDITFCNDKCPIGIKAREQLLETKESVFDVVSDFYTFTENCFNTCLYKAEHQGRGREIT